MAFNVISDPTEYLGVSTLIKLSDKLLFPLLIEIYILQHLLELSTPLGFNDFNQIWNR